MQKSVVIIDIRDEKKWKEQGILPNSYRLSYVNTKKNNNEKKWSYILIRLIKQKNRAFVLISDNGNKAKTLANKLYKEKKFNNVMYLKGGFDAWLDADRKIINF